MRLGIFNMRNEDDVSSTGLDSNIQDPMEQIDADEAKVMLNDLEQVGEGLGNYAEAQEGLDVVEAEATEKLETMKEGENYSEEIRTLESDINSYLACVNGYIRRHKDGSGLLAAKVERDWKGNSKSAYRARVEGIGEFGKKIWEAIKAFFAKIWEFLKGLFERFTALFKSNKSVLEGLKKKLESEEDDKYASTVDGATVSQQLIFFSKYGKDYAKDFTKMQDSCISDASDAFSNIGKDIETIIKEEIEKDVKEKGFSSLSKEEKKDLIKGASSLSEAKGKVKEWNELVREASEKFYRESTVIKAIPFGTYNLPGNVKANQSDFVGKFKQNAVGGCTGITSEGVLFSLLEPSDTGFKLYAGTYKFKSGKDVLKLKSGMRSTLIDICDYGISICEDLDGGFIKDAKENFNDMKKEMENMIEDLTSEFEKAKEEGNETKKEGLKSTINMYKKLVTSATSLFARNIAVLSKQPSEAINAVRNGMSISKPRKD